MDAWMGHRSDRSMAAVYYQLSDDVSQPFMAQVPFGTGEPLRAPSRREDSGSTRRGSPPAVVLLCSACTLGVPNGLGRIGSRAEVCNGDKTGTTGGQLADHALRPQVA
jgi:hypothetical protein